MCLLTVVPLLLSHYPSLSANTPSDLLVTNPSTLYHKSITAIHNGREAVGRAVGRAFTTSEVVETVDSTYFQAWKKGQHLWKPILLLLSSSFLSFSPISIFRKKAFHFWGSWWPRSGQILGYTPCCDWDREMQWWGLLHSDPDCQPHHAGGGEDLAWDLDLHHKLTAVFFLSAEGKRKEKGVVSSERVSLSSPAGNSILCLLPVCCKPALEIKIAREVTYWQHVLNQAFSETPLRTKLPKFLCLPALFLLFPELSGKHPEPLKSLCWKWHRFKRYKWMHEWEGVRSTREGMCLSLHDLPSPCRCSAASMKHEAREGCSSAAPA